MSTPSNADDKKIDITPEQLKQINRRIRQHRRNEIIEHFLERSRLRWLTDPEPFDDYYRMLSLPTNLAARRARFLRPFSWFSLIRRRSERIYQLGLGGLIIAPLVGWIVLHFASSSAHAFPIQLGVLYFSGLFYVLASTLLIWRCPTLIKELCLRTSNSDPDRDKHLVALIDEEILNLKKSCAYPRDTIQFEPKTSDSQLAAAMYASNMSPMMNGFGSQGCYLLQEVFLDFAAKANFRLFYESNGYPSQLRPLERAGKVIEGRIPYIVELYIRKPTPDEMSPAIATDNQINGMDCRLSTPTNNDLVIQWLRVGLQPLSNSETESSLHREYANGLHLLYENGNLEELGWIITRWQNWRELPSRLAIWAFYSFALGLFAVYLMIQTITVWDAMNLSDLLLSLWRYGSK